MADAADSDTSVVLKRRITEIDETLRQQPESSSDSVSSIIVPEESQPVPVVVSPPKEEQESMRNSLNFFKKVKCSSSASECATGGAQELSFEERVVSARGRITGGDTECGSGGSQWNSDSFARKNENLGSDVEKNDNFNMGFVSDGGLKIEEVEDRANGVQEEKDFVETEVGFSGIQEFCNDVVSGELKAEENEKCEGKVEMDYSVEGDNVGGSATSTLAHLAEEVELLVGTRAESGGILEAKKRQLLAELKGGLIFENRTNVNNVTGSENTSVKNDVYKANDGTAGCSIKIDVVDGTALIDAVQIPKSGNGNGKNVERNGKKNEKQDGAAKKPRRTRRKVKDVKMGSDMSVRQRNVTQFVVPLKDGNEIKRMYSREEMEALRFANIMEQHLVWRQIYTGFAPDLVKEYDELARMKHAKNIHSNFNPDRHFGRKTEASLFRREIGPLNMDNELKNTEGDELENLNALDASGGLSVEVEDAYNDVEEYTEDENSDEDYASIQRPAFLVEGEPDFDSGPPEDGLEYLRRVRWEAANIPKVKVVKLDRSKLNKEQSVYMPQIPDIANCAEHLLPLKHWEDSFLADFSNLRLTLSSLDGSSTKVSGHLQSIIEVQKQHQSVQLPKDITFTKLKDLGTNDADSYQHIDSSSLNNSVTQPPRLPTEDVEIAPSLSISAPSKYPIVNLSGNDPTLSTILGMDYVSRASTLRKRISLIQSMDELSRNDCSWLFALCAAVDTPLHADTSAALRSLLRKCANLRAGKSELDDEVAMLNILATISGKYFGQSER